MYLFHNTHSPISIRQHMLLKEQKYITIKQEGKGKQAEGKQRIDWDRRSIKSLYHSTWWNSFMSCTQHSVWELCRVEYVISSPQHPRKKRICPCQKQKIEAWQGWEFLKSHYVLICSLSCLNTAKNLLLRLDPYKRTLQLNGTLCAWTTHLTAARLSFHCVLKVPCFSSTELSLGLNSNET